MTTPAPGPLVERLYERLPEVFRDADSADPGRPLLRYLLVALGDGDELEVLSDRLGAELADPALAAEAWLPWLAQHVGAPLPPTLPEAERRRLIAAGAGGLAAGGRDAIAAAAKRALIGNKAVTVIPLLYGDEFSIGVRVIPLETPDPAAVLAAIESSGARPAGFDVVLTYYSASWDTLEAAYPTSDHWDAVPSWAVLESTPEGTLPVDPNPDPEPDPDEPDPDDPTQPYDPDLPDADDLRTEADKRLATEADDDLDLE